MTPNPFDSQEFRRELGELLDEKLNGVTKMVAEHERILQRSRGAMWAFAAIWTFVVGVAEFFFHRK